MGSVSNKQKARLFDQIATITKLVVNGRRDPDRVSEMFQEIISLTQEPFYVASAAAKAMADRQDKPFQFTNSDSHQFARNIMSKNFLGIPEACEHFKITPTEEQLAELAEIPFSEDTLCECKDTHILVADFGFSIFYVRKCVGRELFNDHEEYPWYYDEQFARETSDFCWRLIRKDMVTNSTKGKRKLISGGEEVPSARAIVYVILLNYLVTGERMLEDTFVITTSTLTVKKPGNYHQILVGCFDGDGISIDGFCVDDNRGGTGCLTTISARELSARGMYLKP